MTKRRLVDKDELLSLPKQTKYDWTDCIDVEDVENAPEVEAATYEELMAVIPKLKTINDGEGYFEYNCAINDTSRAIKQLFLSKEKENVYGPPN